MTGERFTVKGNWIKDRCIGKLLNIDFNANTDAVLCCDLLNNIENKKLENGRIATKLLKENEQLKSKNRGLQSELQIFKEDATHSNLQINKLADENEMIRNTINEMYKNERTQLGKSVLKQLIEAIQ